VRTEQPHIRSGRANQKERTRRAIVDAMRDLIANGAEATMPAAARAAQVSEATAYRYFPDLASLLREAIDSRWPRADEAMAPLADVTDPVRRIAYATEVLLRHVQHYQSAVRAMMSAAIVRPDLAGRRPGARFGLIDSALAPLEGRTDPEVLAQLKLDLAVVVSAESLFTLTDLCGLSPEAAIASAIHTARTLTSAVCAR
jgi:AcrR family transcriptional regulator